MGLGTVTWACLLLATHAGASPPPGGGATPATDASPMNQHALRIPIRVNPARLPEIKELRLYVSRDEGKQWQVAAWEPPSSPHFTFYAQEDGTYWFTVAVVDKKDQQDPPDIMKADRLQVQKIFVDTTRPDIRLTAERQGDEVAARWTVHEDHPDWTSLKLEYRPAEGSDEYWVSVGILPNQNQTTFNPGIPGALLVRAQMKDTAGNLGQTAPVEVAAAPPRPATMTVAHQGDNAPGGPPSRGPQDAVGTSLEGGSAGQGSPPSPRVLRPYEGSGLPLSRPTGPVDPPPLPAVTPEGGRDARPPAPTPGPQPVAPAAPRSILPQLRLVNKPDVNLEFEVSKLGSSGPGNVDAYYTLDEGATWEQYRADMPPTWPAAFEARGHGPVRGSVAVQLKDEGVIYGFYLVVKSKAGLGKPPPQRGEPPQIRIELDRIAPEAELYKPTADPGNREVLILSWRATDRNLAPNPITLEYAENHNGPWHTIGEPQLPNTTPTGHYAWRVSESVPSRVYLKLTARDVAGNVAVAQTREPILVDLAVPDVVVTGASASSPPR